MTEGGNSCGGRCVIHYKNQYYWKSKNNILRIDNIFFNFSWLGFRKCKHCLFFAITDDKYCKCCGFRMSTKRSKVNTNCYKPFSEERDIYDYNYHMMPGFAEMREMFIDQAQNDEERSHYFIKRKRKCFECGADHTQMNDDGTDKWYRAVIDNTKNYQHWICSACYHNNGYHKRNNYFKVYRNKNDYKYRERKKEYNKRYFEKLVKQRRIEVINSQLSSFSPSHQQNN